MTTHDGLEVLASDDQAELLEEGNASHHVEVGAPRRSATGAWWNGSPPRGG